MSNHYTERLFFALWPDDKVLQELKQLNRTITHNIHGKIIPPENWHITLAFLGNIDQTTKQCMEQVAATIKNSRFSLALDQIGYWPRTHILWLGANQMPAALLHLVSDLTTRLQSCDYHPDNRAFHVHVTLMRKAARIQTLPVITPIIWPIKDFCLVRSITYSSGAHYDIMARWALT